MTENEIVVATTTPPAITEAARMMFSSEQVEAIKRTVAKDCNDAELVLFLELCARYALDPFAGQIWAVKLDGRRLSVMVGRDGYLDIANRSPHFRGVTGDVVHEHDTFTVTWQTTADGGIPNVTHTYPPDKPRGEIRGAWSIVYRDDRTPTYFYASIKEYGKTSGAWSKQRSAMILKCAQSTTLRIAFGVTGTTPADEGQLAQATLHNGERADMSAIDWGDDEHTDKLRELFAEANANWPGAFSNAKIKLMLDGDREKLVTNLTAWLDGRRTVDA